MDDQIDEFLANVLSDTEGDIDLALYAEQEESDDSDDYTDYEKTASADFDIGAHIADAEDNLPDDIKESLDAIAFIESYTKVKTASAFPNYSEEEFEEDGEEGEYDEDEYEDDEEYYEEDELTEEDLIYDQACQESIDHIEKTANLDEMSAEEIYDWAFAQASTDLDEIEGDY